MASGDSGPIKAWPVALGALAPREGGKGPAGLVEIFPGRATERGREEGRRKERGRTSRLSDKLSESRVRWCAHPRATRNNETKLSRAEPNRGEARACAPIAMRVMRVMHVHRSHQPKESFLHPSTRIDSLVATLGRIIPLSPFPTPRHLILFGYPLKAEPRRLRKTNLSRQSR